MVPPGVRGGVPRDGRERGLHLYKLCQEAPAGPQQPCPRPSCALPVELQTTNGRSQGDELATTPGPELVGKWTTGALGRRGFEADVAPELLLQDVQTCGAVGRAPGQRHRHAPPHGSSRRLLTRAWPSRRVPAPLKD